MFTPTRQPAAPVSVSSAIEVDDAAAVEQLLASGSSFVRRSKFGATALMLSIEFD